MPFPPRLVRPLLALAACALPLHAAPGPVTLQKGDRICLIGNSLADRFQHDGWFETALQAAAPELELVIRNLGFCGDQVAQRHRHGGYPSHEFYFEHCRADVIFAFFGYNESFAGEAGLDKFKKDAAGMVDGLRKKNYNGSTPPRVVLFSPVAAENTRDPNLPDGVGHNRRLALYTEALRAVAEEKQAGFVDLFTPSQALYAAASAPLTLNGVHLSAEGNRRLSGVIARALTGKDLTPGPAQEKLRQAVLDKDLHWYNRYRATDGNDVWGGRSTLKFVDNQTNAEVLQHELVMLDVMTANRDRRVHAVAQGGDLKVDDTNVPPAVPVISNVGGKSKSSNAQKEGSVEYLSGEAGLAKMKIAPGYEVSLFADETRFPELANPVQLAVDTRGRLWVAAWKTYPKWEPGKPMEDRLLILPDDDRDGKADRAIHFASVHNPTGFEFWNGGVLVASAPDILFLKDTDGDDVADVRVHLLQGIDSADTHHTENGFLYGTDGGLYMQRGVFHVNTVETPWHAAKRHTGSGLYRFDPRRFTYTFHAANSPNPHGTSQDYWGYMYATDGTGGEAYQVVPEGRGFKMRKLLKKTVRPVPASGVISSAQFPPESQGNFLICNTIGFLGIKQYRLDRNAETGEVNGTAIEDLLVSEDKNFRPTDIEFGSDGALYFGDWQNVIIGHMQHNIRDPNRDKKHGRVYRMIASGRPLQAPVAIAGQPLPALLDNLKHPVDGVRYRTRIELSGRPSAEVLSAARTWAAQFDPKRAEHAHHLLEALWLHQQHNVKNPELLTALLASPEPHARRAAQTVQHFWYNVDFTDGAEAVEEKVAAADTRASDPQKGVVVIRTLVEKMAYDVKEFRVKAGQPITLTLLNPDYMPHNILIVKPGATEEVGLAAQAMGADGFKAGFRPESDKILAGTRMLDHGQEDTIRFTAPTEPGKYEFLCTFPGHWPLMRGHMIVTKP
jgi:azurin/lysophospholipase L1-like esterase